MRSWESEPRAGTFFERSDFQGRMDQVMTMTWLA